MTCWRRLYEWQLAGVWQQLHELLLAKLRAADRIDWSRGRSPGFTNTAGFASATNAELRSTRRSSRSPAASSA
jgi:transposase